MSLDTMIKSKKYILYIIIYQKGLKEHVEYSVSVYITNQWRQI